MRYCFDLDGTLCVTVNGDYVNSKPINIRIEKVRQLFEGGNNIIIDTARGSSTGIDWSELTRSQLNEWGVPYHQLRTGKKIEADIYIDDKGCSDISFFEK